MFPTATDVVDGDLQELFGWVVREGVTNVVRHARATACTVTLSPTTVEVSDNGVGGPTGSGSGLTGLKERVTAAGRHAPCGPGRAPRLATPGRGCRRQRQGHPVTIRLLLADDQELVRTALAALLELEDDFEVVTTVGRGDEVVEAGDRAPARCRPPRHRDARPRRPFRGGRVGDAGADVPRR